MGPLMNRSICCRFIISYHPHDDPFGMPERELLRPGGLGACADHVRETADRRTARRPGHAPRPSKKNSPMCWRFASLPATTSCCRWATPTWSMPISIAPTWCGTSLPRRSFLWNRRPGATRWSAARPIGDTLSKRQAERYADSLRRDGYDVFVSGVLAYSTLGWFDDPVLSTFLQLDNARLSALIFHELAHRMLYVPGDTAFNESFATAVEEEGMRRWAAASRAPGLLAEHERRQKLTERLHRHGVETENRVDRHVRERPVPGPETD